MFAPLLLLAATDLLNDTFAGPALSELWTVPKGEWKIIDGRLKGVEIAADKHAAVVRRNVRFTDGTVRYSVMLEGAKAAHLSINGAGGHICRLILTPGGAELRRDKPNAKSQEKPARLAHTEASFAAGTWYRVEVNFRGRAMSARITPVTGGAAVELSGEHEAIAVPKTNIGFPVMGAGAWLDDVQVTGQ